MGIESCTILIWKTYCHSHVICLPQQKNCLPPSLLSHFLSVWQLIFNLQKVFCSSTVPQCHWNVWIRKSLCGCIGLSVFFLTWDDDPAGSRGIWTRDGGSCTSSQVSLFFHIPNRRTGYGGTTLLLPAPGISRPPRQPTAAQQSQVTLSTLKMLLLVVKVSQLWWHKNNGTHSQKLLSPDHFGNNFR